MKFKNNLLPDKLNGKIIKQPQLKLFNFFFVVLIYLIKYSYMLIKLHEKKRVRNRFLMYFNSFKMYILKFKRRFVEYTEMNFSTIPWYKTKTNYCMV